MAASSQFARDTLLDFLFGFDAGVDMGVSPLLLPKNKLAYGSNLTTRGTLIHPRPVRRQYTLDLSAVPTLQSALIAGTWLFQGKCYYAPDLGPETLMASISGRLYQITPNTTTLVATVVDVTGANAQSPAALQCWLWQAENYVFWNDGINLPVFFNGATTTRSTGTPAPPPTFTIANAFTFPAGYDGIKAVPDTIAVTLTGNFTGANGDTINIPGTTFPLSGKVTAGAGTPNITCVFFFTITPPIAYPTITAGTQLQDTQGYTGILQFPVGRMGCYGRGRVWMCLANGKDYIAGDIVGGPSGTKALDFRDAILNVTENSYLVGGGTFTIPGSFGDIRAMIFTAELDASLGQGPLQIFTPSHVFSCNAPIDRLTWQSLTNPIQTVSAIGNGGLGQDSTFLVNSDTIYRALDGIRSLILSRQDFNVWIRTPISHEVERVLNQDNQSLLAFSQGAFFDNRMLMSASPISVAQGVYHQALVALNTDLVTTVREKSPPAYDGVWPGMNVMGLVTGEFSAVERCFQFVFNTVQKTLELWELMPSAASDVENNATPIVGDNGNTPIQWWFESGSLFRETNLSQRSFKRLTNGEIYVDQLVGRVDFAAFYRPDQWACWVPWFSWSACSVQNSGQSTDINKPAFSPRMGLGEPSGSPCDTFNNRPLREFYSMQFKLVATGQCRFIGARFACVEIPEPFFAKQLCSTPC